MKKSRTCPKCRHLWTNHKNGRCRAYYSTGPSGSHQCPCEEVEQISPEEAAFENLAREVTALGASGADVHTRAQAYNLLMGNWPTDPEYREELARRCRAAMVTKDWKPVSSYTYELTLGKKKVSGDAR